MDHLSSPHSVGLVLHPQASGLRKRDQYSTNLYGLEKFDDDDSDGTVVEYFRILKRNRRSIILSSTAGLIIGLAIGIPMKPIYRAQTTLEVLTINEDFMNMKQANPTLNEGDNFDISEEQTQAKLLTSKSLIQRVIAKLDAGSPTNKPQTRPATSGWRALFHLPNPSQSTARQMLLTQAADSLKVSPTARTRVLEMHVDSTDPVLATEFANTLGQEFIAQNMEARWSTNQHTSEWLRHELDDARNKLRKSEDILQAYANSSGLIFTDETTNVATEKLQQVQQSLSAASTDRIARQARFESAQNAPPDSLGDVLSDSGLRDTQAKINDLKRQIADLGTVYSPGYSKVRRLQAELDALQPAFETQRADIVMHIKNDYLEAARREKLLSAAYLAQAQEVTGQDEKAIQYNILKRDVESNRQLYDSMLQQMKQASIASAMRASNVRVVDSAIIPDTPFFPNFKLNALLGILAGLFASITVASVRERSDRTLQKPGDIQTWTALPELGTIPSARLTANKHAYGFRKADAEKPPSHLGRFDTQSPSSGNGSLPLVHISPDNVSPSLISEAFRSALTSILFIGDRANPPKVIVFTSPNPSEGKTTAVANIGLAAAEISMRVLIVDADLRRPCIHRRFELLNERGLADLLQREHSDEGLIGLIRKTKTKNLDVLTAGTSTSAAAHLLYSPRLADFIARCREQYDMILIDSPPMLQMTDARVAAKLADAVILVARSNVTTRDALLAARARLNDDGTPILGAMLNDWDPRENAGGYYGRYVGSTYYNKTEEYLGAQAEKS